MKIKRRINCDWAVKLLFIILYFVGILYVSLNQNSVVASANQYILLSPIVRFVMLHILSVYIVVGGVVLAILFCYPIGRNMARKQFENIGIKNKTGTVPKLIRKYNAPDYSRVTVWEFDNQSIPLDVWEEKHTAIESALDITIVKLEYGRCKRRVLLYTVPARSDLPQKIKWENQFLSNEEFVLTLGESYIGPVTINLAQIPHFLIGGSTGSGKSILLKCLLMQAVRKNAVVCIADFKGGVDFPLVWHEKCQMCFDEKTLLELLNMLTFMLEERKSLFRNTGCPNIMEYNRITGKHLPRYIFGCDEIAEVIDKTGLSKEQKEIVSQVENKLATIARQGRAFGVHLILATQRPDANILSGQIKNNLDCRICGRADNVLSQIILDSTAAADEIPKNVHGRFMLYDGTVFQGFLFDESDW